MITRKLVKAVLFVSTLAGAQAAHAALVSCPTSFTTNPTAKVENSGGTLTAASACQYVTPADNNNVASVANINTAGFFGTNTWQLNGSNLQVGPGGPSGTWTIAGANFAAFDYMIVFKDGNGTNLTGFLFNELFSNGVWSTPFTDPPFDLPGQSTSHDVSHYTIVQRTGRIVPPGGGEVPEPGILALMGLGMAGFAVARRRPSSK